MNTSGLKEIEEARTEQEVPEGLHLSFGGRSLVSIL